MEIISENKCHGGRQLVCRHASSACHTDMTFGIYLPPQADRGPVPVLWYLSGLTCTHANAMEKSGLQRHAAQESLAVVFPDTSPRGEGVADDADYALGQGAGFYVNATIAVGGGLGILIPPSIILVLFAVLTEQFVLDLFAAAIFPDILAICLYLLTIALLAWRRPDDAPASERADTSEKIRAIAHGWRAFVTILLVIVGIYSGVFTVLEAAAVGVAITGTFWLFSKGRSWLALKAVMVDTAALTGMMIVVVIGASAMGYLLTLTNAPLQIVGAVQELGLSPVLVMALVLVMYVILGMVFDSIAAMVLTIPFVFPLIVSLGFDPVW